MYMLRPRGAAKLVVTGQGRIVWSNRHARNLFEARPLRGTAVFDLLLLPAVVANYLTSAGGARQHGSVGGWQMLGRESAWDALWIQAAPIRLARWQRLTLLTVTDFRGLAGFTDKLTGCPGRKAVQDFLAGLDASGRIAVLDLNAMKAINDVHGYTVGDAVIVTVANRLRAGVGNLGTVFRFGGNEYVVLLPALDAEQSERLLAELLAAVSQPIRFGSESVTISATAGLAAVAPSDPLRDLGRANEALRQAKRLGVPYTIYNVKDSKE